MNTIWKADEVDYILGSKSINQWVAKGIQLDSRKVTKGDLFLAMPGTKYDGHFFFIRSVFQRSCCCCRF